MSKYWTELVKTITPYIPGEQPKDQQFIKLNTNENPYPPSPKVIEAINRVTDDTLRLYPDPNCDLLRSAIATHFGLKHEQIFVGNGSDEVLAFAFPAFFGSSKPILFPDITYSFYPVYAEMFKVPYEMVPVDDDFVIPVAGLKKENGGIILPNPNAPTALQMPLEDICEILSHNKDQVVVIDEAYVDFGGESAIKLIDEFPNLLVVQTLSKSRSLAGLRVGFALGHPDLIEGLNRIKNSINSYTLDRLALAGAIAAIEDEAHFQETRLKIITTRERVVENLLVMGFKVIPSTANFIFIRHNTMQASDLSVLLRKQGILVRHFNKPRISNYLRVSIGSDLEMEAFVKIMKEITA